MYPINAIAAASHPDPYPYYRQLAAGPELVFDAGLKLWIASRAAVIREVMANPHCLVRPSGEAVPKAIAGSAAGAIFGRLARMNEGPAHAKPKYAIVQMLAAVDLARVGRRTSHFATMLQGSDGAAITRWMFDLPTCVVADLLGLDEAELPQIASWVADFVRCLSPLSTPEQLERASTAAQALMERFVQADDVSLANQIGLLSQTHEATAGLIGNAIVALLRDPQLQERLRADPQQAGALVRDVARRDPAVQNTRRFVAEATSIAGVALQPGDTILLLLGAADPDEPCGFGHGRHACPGQELACTIAASALQYLLALPQPLALDWTYKPSANARLPQFL
jgi:cytochrome P450